MEFLSDGELVAAILAGREEAMALLDRRFRPRIEKIARRRGIPVQDCQDIAQEALAAAVQGVQHGQFRAQSAFGTWIHAIVGAKIGDYWRRNPHRDNVTLESVAEREPSLIATGNADAVLAVKQALSCLSADDQLLLMLHEQQQHTLEEIGTLIGLRKSAVAERLRRARERFRIAIRDGGKPPSSKRLKE